MFHFHKTIALIFSLLIALPIVQAQELLVRDYTYKMVSTELSPKEALKKAVRDALVTCVQEHMGTQVMNLTQFEKQEKNKNYQERFNEYTQQVSFGFVRKYKVKDSLTQFDANKLVLETRITLDITLFKPESDNDLGFIASTGKATFRNGEIAKIDYSVKIPSYVYLFDLNYKNQYCLIYETQGSVEAGKQFQFPEPGMIFELAMTKEDENDFEFGSFVMVASEKPVNFGVKAAISNNWNFDCLDFEKFFKTCSAIKKDHSIVYIPYCIMEK